MSKARQKGTEGENFFLPHLQELFGSQVDRSQLKGINDWGDYYGVPWLHEAKNTVKPSFMEWSRKAEKKTADGDYAIVWKGDLRRGGGNGPLVVLNLDLYKRLVKESQHD